MSRRVEPILRTGLNDKPSFAVCDVDELALAVLYQRADSVVTPEAAAAVQVDLTAARSRQTAYWRFHRVPADRVSRPVNPRNRLPGHCPRRIVDVPVVARSSQNP